MSKLTITNSFHTTTVLVILLLLSSSATFSPFIAAFSVDGHASIPTSTTGAPNEFQAAIFDPVTEAGYFAGQSANLAGATVCKFDLSSSKPSIAFVKCQVQTDAGGFFSAVYHASSKTGYFGGDGGWICRYNLDSSFGTQQPQCILNSSLGGQFNTAVIDEENNIAYFASYYVCQVTLGDKGNFQSCKEPVGIEYGVFLAGIFDPKTQMGFFSAHEGPSPVITRWKLSPKGFGFLHATVAAVIYTAVIDSFGSPAFGFFGEGPQICKYSLANSPISQDSCKGPPSFASSDSFGSGIIDLNDHFLYFQSDSAQICQFSTLGSSFNFKSCVTMTGSGSAGFNSAVIDNRNLAGYFGTTLTSSSEPAVYKIELDGLTCPASGVLSLSQSDLGPLQMFQFTNVDNCKVTISHVVLKSMSFLRSFTNAEITITNVTCQDSVVCVKFSSSKTESGSSFTIQNLIHAPPSSSPSSPTTTTVLFAAAITSVQKLILNNIRLSSPTESSTILHLISFSDSFSTNSNITITDNVIELAKIGSSIFDVQGQSTSISIPLSSFITLNNNRVSPSSNLKVLHTPITTDPTATERILTTSSGTNVDLTSTYWHFGCNDWVNGYYREFQQQAATLKIPAVLFTCPRTRSISLTKSPSRSLNESISRSSSLSLSASASVPCALRMTTKDCLEVAQCHWCSQYQTCASRNWDCNCSSLSSLSPDLCQSRSNNHCSFCPKAKVCADPTTECHCDRFSEALCNMASTSCKWCSNLNSCSLIENHKCECYYLRDENSCGASDECKWCGKSDQILPVGGSKTFRVLDNFNTCVQNNNNIDQCECAYLSNDFCAFASSPEAVKNNFSQTPCKYCPNLQLCTQPENQECKCGQEYSFYGCNKSKECSFYPAVLTITDAVDYCDSSYSSRNNNNNSNNNNNNGASVECTPVTCQGIIDPSACDASNCAYDYDSAIPQCAAAPNACWVFFVPGFIPQPYLLLVLGIFKDAVVVLLIGAIGDYATRPIMNIVLKVKRKIKDSWKHLRVRVSGETLYMSDAMCRDNFPFSFAEYVEQVCEDCFEFVHVSTKEPPSRGDDDNNNSNNDENKEAVQQQEETPQILDEHLRLKLFDIVAFCLYDNMLWIKPYFIDEDGDEDDDSTNKSGSSYESDETESQNGGSSVLSRSQLSRSGTRRFTFTSTSHRQNNDDEEDNTTTNKSTSTLNATAKDDEATPLVNNNNNSNSASSHQTRQQRITKLTADDFISLAHLRNIVEDTLVDRASSNVYYAQSRDHVVSACANLNSFPTSLSLAYYTIAVAVLYITSLITVENTKHIHNMVSGCNTNTASYDSRNRTVGGSDGNDNNNNNNNNPHSISFFTGSFLLLGFRLMNASAQATSVLIFVKSIRGLYQKYTGLHGLSLQQRIPLMALLADRPLQVLLIVYALVIAPFALAGPVSAIFVNWRTLVPVFFAVGILILNAMFLFGSKWYQKYQVFVADRSKKWQDIAALKGVEGEKYFSDEGVVDDLPKEEQEIIKTNHQQVSTNNVNDDNNNNEADDDDFEEFLDPKLLEKHEDISDLSMKDINDHYRSNNNNQHQQNEDHNRSKLHPARTTSLSSTARSSRMSAASSRREAGDEHDDDKSSNHRKQSKLSQQKTKAPSWYSISPSSWILLKKSIVIFMLTEEIPIFVISAALQISFNYLCLLKFSYAFGIRDDYDAIYQKDFEDRKLHCIWQEIEHDTSTMMSTLSSFIPFM